MKKKSRISKGARTIVERATVSLGKNVARGVLVDGNTILTAAHCINADNSGGMVMGGYYIEDIKTARGTKLKAAPIAVELLYDIAALGSLDGQEFPKEEVAFDRFCAATKPVPLCVRDFKLFKPFPVFILNSNRKWVRGSAQQCNVDAMTLLIEPEERIRPGASGGPIITSSGELLSIVSVFGGTNTSKTGANPRPHLALPVWVCQRILNLGPKPVLLASTRSSSRKPTRR